MLNIIACIFALFLRLTVDFEIFLTLLLRWFSTVGFQVICRIMIHMYYTRWYFDVDCCVYGRSSGGRQLPTTNIWWSGETGRTMTSFGRDERCHVSFSSNSIIFSLCFYYAFIMLSLCFFRYEINKGFFFRRCHLFTYYFPNTRIPLSSRHDARKQQTRPRLDDIP